MKVKTVPSIWIRREGLRLDVGPYTSGALEAKIRLGNLDARRDLLRDITLGGLEGIYHAGREGRTWVLDPDHGVPFVSSSRILAADLSRLPLLSRRQVDSNPAFRLSEGWTLITRSGTIGRMVYVRPGMAGLACSEHVMRVVPDDRKIPPGYLYSYLRSKFGVPLVVSGTFGSIIQSIEPQHIADLPVPRLGDDVEQRVHGLVAEAAHLLEQYQRDIGCATDCFFRSVELQEITATEWQAKGSDLGFVESFPRPESFRALNFNPRFKKLCCRIRSGMWKPLGQICLPGTLNRGGRFKRIDVEPNHGYQLIGQKQLFWLRPEGRWIARSVVGEDVLVEPGTILVAAQGTLGESELFCRAEFAWGAGLELAYSEHILRILADESVMLRGALYAFMRSETAFRMLRSISVGTKLQDHHYAFRPELPVPYPSWDVQKYINNLVTGAYDARHRAVALEDRAITIVERAIEEAT